MNMTHDEMIEIILAHKDGKEIQFALSELPENGWASLAKFNNAPSFNFGVYHYRIKPEPKTIWVNEYKHGAVAVYKNKIDATTATTAGNYGDMRRVAVKYQEVVK